MLLTRLFSQAVTSNPHATAVSMGARTLTYQELDSLSNQIAHSLQAQGVRPGEVVGICLKRSPELIASLIAIFKVGAAYLPLDPEYPQDRLSYMLEHSQVKTLLIQKIFATTFSGNFTPVIFESLDLSALSPAALEIDETDVNLGYVIYTSGSTGKPKGVALGRDALFNLIEWQNIQTQLKEKSITLQFTPVSFDVHFQEIFSTLTGGGELVMIPEEVRLDMQALLKTINDKKVNRLYLPYVALNHMADMSMNHGPLPLSLKEVTTAGEQLKITDHIRSLFKKLNSATLYNHYGPSETHVITSLALTGDPTQWPSLPAIGTAIANCEVYLLDADLRPVAQGQEGELYLAGRCLADGYLHAPELTAERFITTPHLGRLYKTGDIGIVNPDGNIQFLGRKDGQVKIRGYRIELGEIEVALQKFPALKGCAVKVIENNNENFICAYVAGGVNLNHVRDHLRQTLPDYMVPSFFIPMESIPLTPSGKVDYKSLPALNLNRPELSVEYAAPETELEVTIVSLWEKYLAIKGPGIDDRFFDLGGNSLMALKIVADLNKAQKISISVLSMFQYPTVRALAAYILSMGDDSEEMITITGDDRDIAIIAMTGKFPGADSVEALWQNLLARENGVTLFDKTELDASVTEEMIQEDGYVLCKGQLPGHKTFDAKFFGVTPREAELMDPQQRKFLELSHEALELAGVVPEKFKGAIGVFAGMGNSKYSRLVDQYPEKTRLVGDFNVMIGLEKDYIATRVAHKLNLKGPALSLHTGCSTSLVAIIEAVNSLRLGHCKVALAGGIAISGAEPTGHLSQEGGILSHDGVCRPFDADATGTIFTDGGGVVVLKRLIDAEKDGDNILAVIKGVGINNDGADKMSFTAPSIKGQVDVVLRAQRDAQIDPRTISYIEAHGTATPVGDPIEVEALTKAFSRSTQDKHFCVLSSLKGNVGHLTAAAGVGGLIKTVMTLKTGIIPGTANFKKANPLLNLAETPFIVTSEHREYPTDIPRRAGISSFGVGGTNAHIIVEEYRAPIITTENSDKDQLLLISAKTPETLAALGDQVAAHAEVLDSINLARLSYTQAHGRQHHMLREARIGSIKITGTTKEKFSSIFMFPGQGSQYTQMGAELYQQYASFREAFDECNKILTPMVGYDFKEMLFGDKDYLSNTRYAQPALFVIEYALARLVLSMGIKPAAVMGHSVGEFVAATIAGVMKLTDGLTLIAKRAELTSSLPEGSMLSVGMALKDLESYLIDSELDVAALNAPQSTVLAGETHQIHAMKEKLEAAGVASVILRTSHAFHSRMMKPAVEKLALILENMTLSLPQIPMYSTVTGQLEAELLTSKAYWSQHVVNCVKFSTTVEKILSEKKGLMIEVGPRNTLVGLTKKWLTKESPSVALPLLGDKRESEKLSLLKNLGALWTRGIDIKLPYLAHERVKVAAPTYPFDKTTYFLTSKYSQTLPVREEAMSNRESLSQKLVDIFEKSSGMDVGSHSFDTSFVEMGMDSLFLTQVALVLKKELKAPVTFRQLIEEFPSINALTTHLLDKVAMPAAPIAKAATPAPVAAPVTEAPIVATPVASAPIMTAPQTMTVSPTTTVIRPMGPVGAGMEGIIQRQLELMGQQLQLMQGMPLATTVTQTITAPVAAAPVVAPQVTQAAVVEEKKAVVVEKKRGAAVNNAKEAFGAAARITVDKTTQLEENKMRQIQDFLKRYAAKTAKSKTFTQENRKNHADPRVVTGFKPEWKEIIYPIVVKKSKDQTLWDLDDNTYVDMTCGFGSNFFGNGNEHIKKLVMQQIEDGIEIGPQHPLVGEVSRMINEMTGNERSAFCNTGSEAVLGAMRLARTVTGREKIIVFSGSYHGIIDEVIIRGSKKGDPLPAAPGINPSAVANMIVLDYGTEESLQKIREMGDEIAAVLVEPVQSRRCDFHPKEFLQEVRKITTEAQACLIFDEVITGFRCHPAGAQGYFGIRADLCTYGKIVGGGMSIGVVSGKSEYMDALDGGHWTYGDDSTPTVGVTYFAGTFVRHPLALAAAKGALEILKAGGEKRLAELNQRAQKFADDLNLFLRLAGVPLKMDNFGALMKPKWTAECPGGELLFAQLRFNGVHAYDGFPWFVNLAHTEAELQFVLEAFKKAVASMQFIGVLPGGQQVIVDRPEVLDQNKAPAPGAKIGRDAQGNPAWFMQGLNGEFYQLGG